MKLLKKVGILAGILSLSACATSLNNINDKGNLANHGTYDDLIWPNPKDATEPNGVFPNLKNLSKIYSGVEKSDLYYLIGHPHFSEIKFSREWNYIFKFREPDHSVKYCQYKVLFDKDMIARNFYFLPKNCLNTKFDLAADALFPFNKGKVSDIKAQGKEKLNELADYLQSRGDNVLVKLVGYTDYLGNAAYNQALSQERARSVGYYLEARGVPAGNIETFGRGESQPVKQCSRHLPIKELQQCLQPNRRVTVEVIQK